MALYQRRLASSTDALRQSLENRARRLEEGLSRAKEIAETAPPASQIRKSWRRASASAWSASWRQSPLRVTQTRCGNGKAFLLLLLGRYPRVDQGLPADGRRPGAFVFTAIHDV
jgi:hypothetical protein